MEGNDYKASKEAFVSGTTGSTITHVNLISAVAICSIALYGSVRSRFSSPNSLVLVVEWVLLVLPLLLSMTLFAETPLFLCLFLCGSILLVHAIFSKPEKATPLSPFEIPRAPSPSHSIEISPGPSSPVSSTARISISPLPSLTVYRSHMLLMTFLAILAVDFPVFPRSLAKCETFGVSLMDLGVGSFVFSQGVVSAIPILKDPVYLIAPASPKLATVIKKVLPIFFLGIIRVITVKGTEYPEHESEYGTHWNFFFTLALLPVLQVALHPVIIHLPISLLGFLVALSHQIALSLTPLQRYTLNSPRTNLISANKEGLVSLIGYLAIHLFGLSAGTVLLPPSPSDFRRQQNNLHLYGSPSPPSPTYDGTPGTDRQHTKVLQRQDAKTAIELLSYAILWWTCLGLCYVTGTGGGISRRLANLPYVIWVAAYNTSFIMGYLLLDMLASPSLAEKANQSYISTSARLQPSSSTESTYTSAKFGKSKSQSKAPALLEAININGLALFLLVSAFTFNRRCRETHLKNRHCMLKANITTGLVNISISTMYASNTTALLVLSAYSFGLSSVAWVCREARLWRI
ncbi:GWT1-domain-containing protein [Phellopilus nigrolimitatus]|nr:GWT1-domain-containing protein [Phellopilus nigrolimitatus]